MSSFWQYNIRIFQNQKARDDQVTLSLAFASLGPRPLENKTKIKINIPITHQTIQQKEPNIKVKFNSFLTSGPII